MTTVKTRTLYTVKSWWGTIVCQYEKTSIWKITRFFSLKLSIEIKAHKGDIQDDCYRNKHDIVVIKRSIQSRLTAQKSL